MADERELAAEWKKDWAADRDIGGSSGSTCYVIHEAAGHWQWATDSWSTGNNGSTGDVVHQTAGCLHWATDSGNNGSTGYFLH